MEAPHKIRGCLYHADLSLNPQAIIDLKVQVSGKTYFLDVGPVFPDAALVDMYYLPPAPPTASPCFCGKNTEFSDDTQEDWNYHFDCTILCKIWKRLKLEQRNGPSVHYFIFAEAHCKSSIRIIAYHSWLTRSCSIDDCKDIPTMGKPFPVREPSLDKGILLIRKEDGHPANVRMDEAECSYVKRFLTSIHGDGGRWVCRFPAVQKTHPSGNVCMSCRGAYQRAEHLIEPNAGELADDESVDSSIGSANSDNEAEFSGFETNSDLDYFSEFESGSRPQQRAADDYDLCSDLDGEMTLPSHSGDSEYWTRKSRLLKEAAKGGYNTKKKRKAPPQGSDREDNETPKEEGTDTFEDSWETVSEGWKGSGSPGRAN